MTSFIPIEVSSLNTLVDIYGCYTRDGCGLRRPAVASCWITVEQKEACGRYKWRLHWSRHLYYWNILLHKFSGYDLGDGETLARTNTGDWISIPLRTTSVCCTRPSPIVPPLTFTSQRRTIHPSTLLLSLIGPHLTLFLDHYHVETMWHSSYSLHTSFTFPQTVATLCIISSILSSRFPPDRVVERYRYCRKGWMISISREAKSSRYTIEKKGTWMRHMKATSVALPFLMELPAGRGSARVCWW